MLKQKSSCLILNAKINEFMFDVMLDFELCWRKDADGDMGGFV